HGKMLESDLEARRDALEVIRQQVLPEVPGCLDGRPGHAGTLVRAHEHRATLFAQIDLAVELDTVQLFFLAFERGNLLGDEVLVLPRQNAQLDTDHARDFPSPEPSGIDNLRRMHVAVVGYDIPRAVGPRL